MFFNWGCSSYLCRLWALRGANIICNWSWAHTKWDRQLGGLLASCTTEERRSAASSQPFDVGVIQECSVFVVCRWVQQLFCYHPLALFCYHPLALFCYHPLALFIAVKHLLYSGSNKGPHESWYSLLALNHSRNKASRIASKTTWINIAKSVLLVISNKCTCVLCACAHVVQVVKVLCWHGARVDLADNVLLFAN